MSPKTSIQEQALSYLDETGNLDDLSTGKLSIVTYKNIKDSLNLLWLWDSSQVKDTRLLKPSNDPLHKIFTSIMSFCPLSVFDGLIENKSMIQKFINYEASNHPEFDLNADVGLVIQVLEQTHSHTPIKLCSLIVKLQVVSGFLSYLESDYLKAINNFSWVLKFLRMVAHKFGSDNFFSKSEYLSPVSKRYISVLYGQCLILNNETSVEKLKSSLIYISSYGSGMNIIRESIGGRACFYFFVCGNIYERLAYLNATRISVESTQTKEIHNVLRFSKEHVMESIRKYILATTLTPSDDARVVCMYDKILWNLLMYGGIHVKTLWFFKFLRDHFQTTSDLGPINFKIVADMEFQKIFPESELDANSGWLMVYEMFNFKNKLSKDEIKQVWEKSNGVLSLIPQVFIDTEDNSLILMDEFYDESSVNGSDRGFIMGAARKAKRKINGRDKERDEHLLTTQINLSRELIRFWTSCYTEHQIYMPQPIKDFLKQYV